MVVLESTRKVEVGVGQNIVNVNVEGQLSFTVVAVCVYDVQWALGGEKSVL